MGLITFKAYQEGNAQRLTHGFDFYGRLCGVDEGVELTPYLYFCSKSSENSMGLLPQMIDLNSATCVAECPNTTSMTLPCLQDEDHKTAPVTGGQFGTVETIEMVSSQSIVEVPTYPSKPFGGLFCVPRNMGNQSLQDSVLQGPLGGTQKALNSIGSLRRAVPVMAGACVLSIILG